ncbi:MAG TPA: hypothetical protein VGF48_10350 [Thermoanaerobaculia bacterium]|jgi:hypothetical protein
MYTITITGTTRERVVDSGEEQLVVAAAIKKDGRVVDLRNLGFPLDKSEDEIREELAKVLAAYVRDQEIATQTQRSEELNANADELKEKLEGMSIEHASEQKS